MEGEQIKPSVTELAQELSSRQIIKKERTKPYIGMWLIRLENSSRRERAVDS